MSREYLPTKTQEQHRISHPLPSALALASNPLPILREQALVHGRHRHETVAETLALVGIMRHYTVLTGRELVTVVGAKFQHGEGSQADQIQAAHCLPGQLVFDSCLTGIPGTCNGFISNPFPSLPNCVDSTAARIRWTAWSIRWIPSSR